MPFDQPGVELGKRFTYGMFGRPGMRGDLAAWDALPKSRSEARLISPVAPVEADPVSGQTALRAVSELGASVHCDYAVLGEQHEMIEEATVPAHPASAAPSHGRTEP